MFINESSSLCFNCYLGKLLGLLLLLNLKTQPATSTGLRPRLEKAETANLTKQEEFYYLNCSFGLPENIKTIRNVI